MSCSCAYYTASSPRAAQHASTLSRPKDLLASDSAVDPSSPQGGSAAPTCTARPRRSSPSGPSLHGRGTNRAGGTETEFLWYRTCSLAPLPADRGALPRWPPFLSTALRPTQYIHALPAVCVGQTGRATRQREMEIGLETGMEMEWKQQDPHGGTDVREPVMFLDLGPSFVLVTGHGIRVYACGWRRGCVASTLRGRGMMPLGNFGGYIAALGCES